MAGRALPFSVEILLARFYVAGLQVGDFHAAPAALLRFGKLLFVVDVGGNIFNLWIAELEAAACPYPGGR